MSDPVKDYPPYLDYPKPRKKQTNADRIRTMTNEELATFIAVWGNCPEGHFLEDPNCFSCKRCWLNWLKQEVPE